MRHSAKNKPASEASQFTALLVTYSVSRHHQFLRAAMPFLGLLVEKVAQVHGESEPRLVELARVFGPFRASIDEHLDQQADALFRQRLCSAAYDPRIEAETQSARAAHDQLTNALLEMRKLTDGFTAPEWACATYRTLLTELAALETDVLRHIEIETRILAPRSTAA
jgi:regulator of cell morphogenesis and NO signaling